MPTKYALPPLTAQDITLILQRAARVAERLDESGVSVRHRGVALGVVLACYVESSMATAPKGKRNEALAQACLADALHEGAEIAASLGRVITAEAVTAAALAAARGKADGPDEGSGSEGA